MAKTATSKRRQDKADEHQFTCSICDNTFAARADTAVCNGLNIRADKNSNPILDDNGWVQVVDIATGERAQDPDYGNVLVGYGHAPTQMKASSTGKKGA